MSSNTLAPGDLLPLRPNNAFQTCMAGKATLSKKILPWQSFLTASNTNIPSEWDKITAINETRYSRWGTSLVSRKNLFRNRISQREKSDGQTLGDRFAKIKKNLFSSCFMSTCNPEGYDRSEPLYVQKT